MRDLTLALLGDWVAPASIVTRREATDGRRNVVGNDVGVGVVVVVSEARIGPGEILQVDTVLRRAHLLHLKFSTDNEGQRAS